MDFIKKLLSSFRFDTILIKVDQLTKQAIFIPAHNTITSIELTQLFVIHIFSKNSILSHITSNQGLEFVSKFLRIALNIYLHFTLGHHPEGDNQTKHTDQTLKQYLYVYCNYQPDNWSELLFLVKFAYNNTLSTMTSVFLFFTNKGYYPNISVYSKHNITFFQVYNFVININDLQSTLESEIFVAQQHYQKSSDQHYLLALDFCIG